MLSVLLILPLTLLVNGCPEVVWPECNWEEELYCWGGYDAEGCQMPSYCFPYKNGMTGDDGTECWSSCPMTCGETEVSCPGDFYDGCPMSDYCMPMDTGCPTVCPPVTGVECGLDEMMCGGGTDSVTGCEMPGTCVPNKIGTGNDGQDCWNFCPTMCDYDAGQMYCDGGSWNGCYMGGYCESSWGDCPATCKPNCNYDAGEQSCDNGVDDNGCWMGNHCAMECPVVCPPMTHVTCNTDELLCGGGLDSNGCEMPEICIPMVSGTGDDGQDCWSMCPVTCDYDDGQIYCDGGFYNGCANGGYCAHSYGDCPALCSAHCDYDAGEFYCDMGVDDNKCWLGNFCSTEECPTGTYGR